MNTTHVRTLTHFITKCACYKFKMQMKIDFKMPNLGLKVEEKPVSFLQCVLTSLEGVFDDISVCLTLPAS